MISCSKCKKATLPVADGGCIKTGGIVDIGCENGEPRPITHADRIRSMTDEELADFVWGVETAGRAYGPRGEVAWLKWLKQEVSE